MAGMNSMMNHGTRIMRPSRRVRPSVARTAAAVIATAAACSGSPSSARSLKSAAALLLAPSAGISVRRMAMHLGDGDVRQY
jgi:hypothetical protein